MTILSTTTPIKLVIGTDPGIDDCHAIMMALPSSHIQILGLTIVTGNTSLAQGIRKAHFLLHTFERHDIPVFCGADRALDGFENHAPHIHGEDGFWQCHSWERHQVGLIKR
jgi:purine nucleosidase